MSDNKPIVFSGIQPSGILTLGNFLGAVSNWITLQDQYCCYYCVVDLHALTVRQNPSDLRKHTLDVLALLIAAGINPEKSVLYVQSQVSEHTELAWILDCYVYMGELSRMTQFKEKSQKAGKNINAGLFTYPVLMAADILLYRADLVPVGADQKQHLELSRTVAERFNNIYGDVFTIPEPYIMKSGARIMSLQDPTKKMSKSDENVNGYISMLDEPDVIRRKIKRAVTDSENIIKFDESKPGISNLLSIYAAASGKNIEECADEFKGKGYGELKKTAADAAVALIEPVQSEYKKIRSDKAYLFDVVKRGADNARRSAEKTLYKVKKKVGLITA